MYKRILLSVVVVTAITIITITSLSIQYGQASEPPPPQPETSTSTEGTTSQSGEERRQGAKDSAGANIDYESYPRTLFPTEPPDISTRIKNLATYCLCAGGACGCSKRGDCTEPCAGVTSRPTAPAPVYELACKCGVVRCSCPVNDSCTLLTNRERQEVLGKKYRESAIGSAEAKEASGELYDLRVDWTMRRQNRCLPPYDVVPPMAPREETKERTIRGRPMERDEYYMFPDEGDSSRDEAARHIHNSMPE